MNNIIEIKDIVKKYKIYDKPIDRLKESVFPSKRVYHKEFKALDGVSFDVSKGDAIGILGKNGSGKSTLLKLITGVLTQTSGTINLNGKVAAILELGAGFNPEYTGIENIYLNGTMMGYSKEEMNDRIQNITDFADIGDFINQPVKVYSSGMFARLAFAVAINVNADILIVDEALAVGDTRFQIKCINKMKELKNDGTTILFVSHATEQVKRFCNKAIWLKDGKINAQGESSEIADLYEDYMKYDSQECIAKDNINIDQKDFKIPTNEDILGSITEVKLNNEKLSSFEELVVEVEYEIYKEKIDGFLLGVAIYTPNREYIFGPNTNLEKIKIPNTLGRHRVIYRIPKITLLGGNYCIDIGIFNNEGIVCIDYKADVCKFQITNKYISEGKFYLEHKWEVIK